MSLQQIHGMSSICHLLTDHSSFLEDVHTSRYLMRIYLHALSGGDIRPYIFQSELALLAYFSLCSRHRKTLTVINKQGCVDAWCRLPALLVQCIYYKQLKFHKGATAWNMDRQALDCGCDA